MLKNYLLLTTSKKEITWVYTEVHHMCIDVANII